MSTPDPIFWKRKLAALLHDPPSKCLDIPRHTEQSEKAMLAAGLGTKDERQAWDRVADHTAAAADRFPFPDHNKSSLRCFFDGVKNKFHHPLSGAELSFDGPFLSAEEGIEGEQTTQPVVQCPQDFSEGDTWRSKFFAHWRLWSEACQRKDWRLGYLPADTRIPDHSIWSHMQMVSAFEGSRGNSGNSSPAILKLQIGPVQEFIQAARSTRDLWSGSYLLSWLMAQGLARLSLLIGPDSVVFPNLKNQPIFDLALKPILWDFLKIGNQSIWNSHDAMKWSHEDLMTPNLPNVFLALIPVENAEEIAKQVEDSIRKEWKRIADSVWEGCEQEKLWECNTNLPKGNKLKDRWDEQIEQFLSISWSITPVPEDLETLENSHAYIPMSSVRDRYQVVKQAAEMIRQLDHADKRYFTDEGKLKNIGIAWSLAVSLASWELDSVRQTRVFSAKSALLAEEQRQGQWFNKDSLTGKEEAVGGGENWVKKEGRLASRFKHDDLLGAPTLIKRLWDLTYLNRWDLTPLTIRDTRALATRDDRPEDSRLVNQDDDKYFAVIAFDGDDMGKWVAGDKTPPFRTQLADYSGGGSLEYFTRPSHSKYFEKFLNTERPLSPGYHLQFSECLSNFALRCARAIVKSYDGILIYAGGDDVVALLPADTALECARELRNAFRGDGELCNSAKHGISIKQKGFLIFKDYKDDHGTPIPVAVPGARASASVGIAISHYKSPLQDAVKAAQAAEKTAKKNPNKDSVAVSLLKRSGEIVEWSARWDDGGVSAAITLIQALRDDVVSGKFPYRLAEFISIYRNQPAPLASQTSPVDDFNFIEVAERELITTIERQKGRRWKEFGSVFEKTFSQQVKTWLQSMSNHPDAAQMDHVISQFLGLCALCGFSKRQ